MDNTHTTTAQATLQQLREQLLARIAQQRGGQVSRVDMAAAHDLRDVESHARAITEMDEEFALNEHETAELMAIDAALERVAKGQYGQCTDCADPIAPERLQAYPTALRCIRCQSAAEHTR